MQPKLRNASNITPPLGRRRPRLLSNLHTLAAKSNSRESNLIRETQYSRKPLHSHVPSASAQQKGFQGLGIAHSCPGLARFPRAVALGSPVVSSRQAGCSSPGWVHPTTQLSQSRLFVSERVYRPTHGTASSPSRRSAPAMR